MIKLKPSACLVGLFLCKNDIHFIISDYLKQLHNQKWLYFPPVFQLLILAIRTFGALQKEDCS